MSQTRLNALLPRLIERTRSGQLGWVPVATEGANAFVHVLPEGAGSLVVRRLYSTYQLTLRNANGAQLESLGEMQEVAGVEALWRLAWERQRAATDTWTALEDDLEPGSTV